MLYFFKNEDGSASDVSIRIGRVSPLLPGRVRASWAMRKPPIPVQNVQRPDGTYIQEQNDGHPDYKAALKKWDEETSTAIVDAITKSGVHADDKSKLEGRTSDELIDLASTILRVSMVTDEGVRRMASSVDPMLFESIVAARWADQDIDDFLAKDADYQNLIVASHRFARALANRGSKVGQ